MFFPIDSDRRLRVTPWVNYTLIALNVLIFLFSERSVDQARELAVELGQTQARLQQAQDALRQQQELWSRPLPGAQRLQLAAEIAGTRHAVQQLENRAAVLHDRLEQHPVARMYLQPSAPKWYQFLTYQFLHAGIWHLAGNMLFLWVFGNVIEDRLGHIFYPLFYLAGGAFAGFGHLVASDAPVLGASGAVAGVAGAFLALTPLTNITIVYWFFFIGSFQVRGMVMILFYIVADIVLNFSGAGGVAYVAHLAGYLWGFTIGIGLLITGLLSREPYDMLALIKQRRRRSQFQKLAKEGYRPWEHHRPGDPPADGKARRGRKVEDPVVTAAQQQIIDDRAAISAALAGRNLDEAASRYAELMDRHPDQVMGQQQQLDVANQLMARRDYPHAARAYELLLDKYPGYHDKAQVQLILGLILARYLDRPADARPLLEAAKDRLTGGDQRLAEQTLGELPA
jgi:membrane associated rhomboid family serine protease